MPTAIVHTADYKIQTSNFVGGSGFFSLCIFSNRAANKAYLIIITQVINKLIFNLPRFK
jgi:hypothetical protein